MEELAAWGTVSLHLDSGCSWWNSNYKHTGRTLEAEDKHIAPSSYIVLSFVGEPGGKPETFHQTGKERELITQI